MITACMLLAISVLLFVGYLGSAIAGMIFVKKDEDCVVFGVVSFICLMSGLALAVAAGYINRGDYP